MLYLSSVFINNSEMYCWLVQRNNLTLFFCFFFLFLAWWQTMEPVFLRLFILGERIDLNFYETDI